MCAHSQVKRINLGPDCGRKANWGKRAGRRFGGASAARVVEIPGSTSPELAFGAQLCSREDTGPRRASSLETCNEHRTDPFSTEGRVLKFNAEAPEVPNPVFSVAETLSAQDTGTEASLD